MSEIQARRYFVGVIPSAVDKQRRIAFPKVWRLDTDTERTQFFLFPAQNGHLYILTEERANRLYDLLSQSSIMDDEKMAAFAELGALMQVVNLDKQGRFTLNQNLAAYTGIQDAAEFRGGVWYGLLAAPGRPFKPGGDGDSFNIIRMIEDSYRRTPPKQE